MEETLVWESLKSDWERFYYKVRDSHHFNKWHMKLKKVVRFFETDVFVCGEMTKFTSSPALQKLYCSCFYIVLSFVFVKCMVNCRKFLDICHNLFFLFCCLFSVFCRNLITTALLAKIPQKQGRAMVILPKNLDPTCCTVYRALCLQ